MIDACATARREGGMWKIEVRLPDWVIDDILLDADSQKRTVVILPFEPLPGASMWNGRDAKKQNAAIAMPLFQEAVKEAER